MSDFYLLNCEICNYRQVTSNNSDVGLYENKTSPVPGGLPYLDQEKKEIVVKPSQPQIKKFRCPKCGRGIIAKPAKNPQDEVNKRLDQKKRAAEAAAWFAQDAATQAEYEASKKEYENEHDAARKRI